MDLLSKHGRKKKRRLPPGADGDVQLLATSKKQSVPPEADGDVQLLARAQLHDMALRQQVDFLSGFRSGFSKQAWAEEDALLMAAHSAVAHVALGSDGTIPCLGGRTRPARW